jgi:hypothetical protein
MSFSGAVKAALAELGVEAGATVMVHSDLQRAGVVRDADGRLALRLDCESLFATFCELLTEAGSLVVPTFSFSWSAGEPFDPMTTRSSQGAFSEFVRTRQGAVRSANPMASVAVVGPAAALLDQADADHCFGPDGAYGHLCRLDALQVMIGSRRNSLNDHVQVTRGTPYRYAKFFPEPGAEGPDPGLCRHDVRYRCLGPGVRDSLDVVGDDLGPGLASRSVETLDLYTVSSRTLAAAIRRRLDDDPFAFQATRRHRAEIERIDAMHQDLATLGGRQFALAVDGRERWFYLLPRDLAPAADAIDSAWVVAGMTDPAHGDGDDSRMLGLAADHEGDLWPAVRAGLRSIAGCDAEPSIADAARLTLWTLH